ncbi:hypothetical protein fh0823_21510 [Francisella halioticida]|uniref:Uncharacterized protein n=1 Tax=Francisella halioticida TaxID=549298 RepID=A0ABM6LWJ5_9GAMM|nr:hypothetical protein CDV26_00255 [Francisella halioticida]BCD92012.1 hypothetical protein fh0823_21510 [Francisella halioticida]
MSLSQSRLINKYVKNDSIINVSDSFSYKGDISILYTKLGIENVIIPEIKSYNTTIKLLSQYSINTNSLENYYNLALDNYISSYKKTYIDLIGEYKTNISANDIMYSLSLMTSANSQFNNILGVLSRNTTLDCSIRFLFDLLKL